MSTAPHGPSATVDDLYATLDPLAYSARMHALAAWTRDQVRNGAGTDELRLLLDELDTRGRHGRGLAVVAASVARDIGFLEARLADGDAVVRGHALKATLRDAALELTTAVE